MLLSAQEIKYFQENKSEITEELLELLRNQGKEGKRQALEILDIPKDNDNYYLDAYGSRISYNGIRSLKKAFTKMQLSKIHLIEIEKCSKDILYFLNNYIRMTTPKGFNFIDARRYQNEFLKILENRSYENIISMQPRQSSKSTTTGVYFSHLFCFSQDLTIGIVAYDGESAREFLDKAKKMIISLPIWLQPGMVVWNKGSIECENNVRILTDSPSSDSFRGFSVNVIVVDECLEYDTIINIYSETLNESFDIKIGDFYNLINLRFTIINKFTNFAKPTNYDLLEKYVDFCLFKQTDKIKGETESHHILPKNVECFPQYSKSKWNLVNLTFRDHFIAHSILAECYPDINKILLAWYMMANKNSKTKIHNLNKAIDANMYEKLKKEAINKISYINSQIVSVKKNGKWIKVSKEEYRNNKKIYETPGLNKIYCENIITGEKIWLDKINYNPKIYKTHNSNMCTMVNAITKKIERIPKNERIRSHIGLNKFITVCRNNVHCTIQAKYIKDNDVYITDYKQTVKNIKLLSILIRKHLGMRKKCEKSTGMVTCFDVEQKIFKRISKKIFDANRDRYLGTTNKKIKEYI